MSAVEEELEMVLSLYTDECERDTSRPYALIVHLPFRFDVQVIVPANGYPEESYPQLYVTAGPNAQLVSEFSVALNRRMREEVPLGFPLLVPLIGMAQSLAEETKDAKETEDAELQRQQEAEEEAILQNLHDIQNCGIEIWCGDAITDRRSKFVAHMAPVHSDREIALVLDCLRSVKNIGAAAHPTIYAYRYTDEKGVLQRNNDDDGEHGAAERIAFLLEQLNVDGYLVTVTRWWGGILLGPDRFKHIMQVAKDIILTIPAREEEMRQRAKAARRGTK